MLQSSASGTFKGSHRRDWCNRHRHFSIGLQGVGSGDGEGWVPLRKFGLFLPEDLISGGAVTFIGGSDPSWKGKHFRSHKEEDESIAALRRSLLSSPKSVPHPPTVTAIGTQLAAGEDSSIWDQLPCLESIRRPLCILWERLIDCLEFTGPLPMLKKETRFSSTATEQKL